MGRVVDAVSYYGDEPAVSPEVRLGTIWGLTSEARHTKQDNRFETFGLGQRADPEELSNFDRASRPGRETPRIYDDEARR